VGAGPNLPTRGSEVEADPLRATVRTHGLAEHGHPRLRSRQPAIETPPTFPAIGGAIHRRLPIDRGTRPHRPTIHGQHPRRLRIARMQDDGKADIPRFLRHGAADAHPAPPGSIQAVDTAMILLVEPVWRRGVKCNAVRIM